MISEINVVFEDQEEFNVELDPIEDFDVGFSEVPEQGTYDGPFSVTPTEEVQVLRTESQSLSQNITVNPIPSNYGLITWDGTHLTVS